MAGLVMSFVIDPSDPAIPNMILILMGLLSFTISVVLFYVSLAYMKRLAHQSMNPRIIRRASRLTWVVPLWAIVGALIVIGPLVALALYYNLFLWLQKDIKAHVPKQARADV